MSPLQNKYVIILVGSLILALILPEYLWIGPALAIWGNAMFPRWRWQINTVIAAYLWIFTDAMAWSFLSKLAEIHSFQLPNFLLLRPLAIATVIAMGWLGYRFLTRQRFPILMAICLVSCFIVVTSWIFGISPQFGIYLIACVLFMTRAFWAYAYMIKDYRKVQGFHWYHLGILYPPWQMGISLPLHLGPVSLLELEAKNEKESIAVFRSGLRMCTRALIAWLLWLPLHSNIFELPHISLETMPSQAHFASAGIAQTWLALGVAMIRGFLQLFYIGTLAIGSARLMGFNLHPSVDIPFGSKNPSEAWRRLQYYYVEVIFRFSVRPIYRKLAFVKNSNLKFFVACTTGIVWIGLIWHFWKYLGLLPDFTLTEMAKVQLKRLPYYIFIGLFTCSVIVFYKLRLKNKMSNLGVLVFVIVYFMAALYHRHSWESFSNLICGLLGI